MDIFIIDILNLLNSLDYATKLILSKSAMQVKRKVISSNIVQYRKLISRFKS